MESKEMNLEEYCGRLPKCSLVNKELKELKKLRGHLYSLAITHPHLVPFKVEVTYTEYENNGN